MKKITLLSALGLLVLFSCSKKVQLESSIKNEKSNSIPAYKYKNPYNYDKLAHESVEISYTKKHEISTDNNIKVVNKKENNENEVFASESDDIFIHLNKNPIAERIKAASENKKVKAMISKAESGKKLHILSLVGFGLWVIGLIPGFGLIGLIGLGIAIGSLFALMNKKTDFIGKAFAVIPVAVSAFFLFLSAMIFMLAAGLVASTFTFGAGIFVAFGIIFLIFAGLLTWLLAAYAKK